MSGSWPVKMIRAVFVSAGLYFVFHFPLLLAYSALGRVWAPLAALIPPLVLYVVYRRDQLRIRHRILFFLGSLGYQTWTAGFTLGILALAWLIDRWVWCGVLIAAGLVIWLFPKKKYAWANFALLVLCLTIVVAREPWLLASVGRIIFGVVLLMAVGALFRTGEIMRIGRNEYLVLLLLAPLISLLTAFYRAPDLHMEAKTEASAVRFLFSAGQPAAPSGVRDGADLRFAARDCDGALLVGGARSPGLERIDQQLSILDARPTGDNLEVICTGRRGLLYGTRTGEVVFQPADGAARQYRMDAPVLVVQADWIDYRAFVMDHWRKIAALSLPNLGLLAERQGGVNIDLLFEPGRKVLYRSAAFRGVEMLEPETLQLQGAYALPFSVGGTLAFDPDHQRLYISDWLGTKIRVLDGRDLRPVALLSADRGIRRLVYDRVTELLLAGSYFRGDVLVYRPYQGGPPWRLPVGRRVRDLRIEGRQCLGVSAAGIFSLDLDHISRSISR